MQNDIVNDCSANDYNYMYDELIKARAIIIVQQTEIVRLNETNNIYKTFVNKCSQKIKDIKHIININNKL